MRRILRSVQWGNRRFVVVALVVAGVVTSLAGCAGSAAIPGSAVEDLGRQAIGFTTPAPSPGGSTPWVGTEPCPAGLEQAERASLPAGGTLTVLDPLTIHGVTAVPDLFQGDVPNCAFQLTKGTDTAQQSVFFGMPESYAAAMTLKLESEGFVAGTVVPAEGGTKQTFMKGTSEVGTERLLSGSTHVFIVVG